MWGRREVMEDEVDASVMQSAKSDLHKWPTIEKTALSANGMNVLSLK